MNQFKIKKSLIILISLGMFLQPFIIFPNVLAGSYNLSLEMRAANLTRGDNTWSRSLTVSPGDKVVFLFKYANLADDVTNVILRDVLPNYFTYINGSTKKYENNQWISISDDSITDSGLNVGDLKADEGNQFVSFKALVAENLPGGNYINFGFIKSDQTEEKFVQFNLTVNVIPPNLSIKCWAANITRGETKWTSNSLSASPGDILSFLVGIKNNGGKAFNVKIKNVLPSFLTYVNNSTKKYENNNWIAITDETITSTGLNIGNLTNSDGTKYYSFRAVLSDKVTGNLINQVFVSADWTNQSSASFVINVIPSNIASFTLIADSKQIAGRPFTLSVVNARTIQNQPANGTVILSFISGGGNSPNGTKPILKNIYVSNGSGATQITLFNAVDTVILGISGNAQAQTNPISVSPAALASISVTPSSTTVIAGKTKQFTAQGQDAYGNKVAISPTWTTNAGTIDQNGLLTAQNEPTNESKWVRATVGEIVGQATITKITASDLGGFDLEYVNQITAGQNLQVIVTARDINGYIKDDFSGPISFESTDNKAVLPTDDGKNWINGRKTFNLIFKTAGDQTFTVLGEGISKMSEIINVSPAALSRLVISPSSASLKTDESIIFSVKGFDQFNNQINNLTVNWLLSDENIGTIDQNGKFTAGTIGGTFKDAVCAQSGEIKGCASLIITAISLSFSIVSGSNISFNLNPAAGIVSDDNQKTVLHIASTHPYLITAFIDHQLRAKNNEIPAWDGVKGFGFSLDKISYHPFPDNSSPTIVITSGNQEKDYDIWYKIVIDWQTKPGNYSATITYTATGVF